MFHSIGTNLPQDLFAATGRYGGPVAVDADREGGPASQWLESKFAPWARPIVNQWAAGEFDDCEAVIFSRADDTAHRLYYYICELQRRGLVHGPEALVLDIAKIARPSSLERTSDALRQMAKRLEVSDADLEEAIFSSNVKRRGQATTPRGRACLLIGTAPPDHRLHHVIEAAGFAPQGTVLAEDWAALGPIVAEATGDPISALAQQLHEWEEGPRSFANPAAHLARAIERSDAQAVILWRVEEDEAQSWLLPAQRRFLEKSGLPHLVLTRRDWRARDGVSEEINRFLEEIA